MNGCACPFVSVALVYVQSRSAQEETAAEAWKEAAHRLCVHGTSRCHLATAGPQGTVIVLQQRCPLVLAVPAKTVKRMHAATAASALPLMLLPLLLCSTANASAGQSSAASGKGRHRQYSAGLPPGNTVQHKVVPHKAKRYARRSNTAKQAETRSQAGHAGLAVVAVTCE